MIPQEKYNEIKKIFPLNAVELIVRNHQDEILILKRENEPAKDQWWIPGGRVLMTEARLDAAKRLLKNECNVLSDDFRKLGMFEYTVKNKSENYYQHIISSVYEVKITASNILLDSQSSEYRWVHISEWQKYMQHDFLKEMMWFSSENSSASFFEKEFSAPDKKLINQKLYSVILKSLAIPCVDILVRNFKKEILLVKRKNEPAKDKWWVPGGRVWFGEKRTETAKRKLKEECSLEGENYLHTGTYEFVYNINGQKIHNISTLYEVTVSDKKVVLDEQSSDYRWCSPQEWLKQPLDKFIIEVVNK